MHAEGVGQFFSILMTSSLDLAKNEYDLHALAGINASWYPSSFLLIRSLFLFVLRNRLIVYVLFLFIYCRAIKSKNLRVLSSAFRYDLSRFSHSVLFGIISALVALLVYYCCFSGRRLAPVVSS